MNSKNIQPSISSKMRPQLARFQCPSCPREYTRAFSLRNHLRTHTDERPFVCGTCGRAFTRQHDRKTHEQLHSGEKSWICTGRLKSGENWGCGRRYGRKSNLRRHFRSKIGRCCIKPLQAEETTKNSTATVLTCPTHQSANVERIAAEAPTMSDHSGVSSTRTRISRTKTLLSINRSSINSDWRMWIVKGMSGRSN